MGDVEELSGEERTFIDSYLPPNGLRQGNQTARDELLRRPFVTLTYASSMDSMISLAPGVRTTLSGPRTKSMTHYLRMHHDAILVGVGTAVADDPGLNCRYPASTLDSQPRPVVLDPLMRWNLADAKVIALAGDKKGKAPWVVHSTGSDVCEIWNGERFLHDDYGLAQHSSTQTDLAEPKRIPWHVILTTLKRQGINSIMVEGGATIINDLLARPDLLDAVIVTIAPTWLGQGGVVVSPAPSIKTGTRRNAARLQDPGWMQFGDDVVLCGKPATIASPT